VTDRPSVDSIGPLSRVATLAAVALPDVAYRVIGRFSVSRFDRALHPVLYRLTGGRWIMGRILGARMILLTTTGRRSGRARTVALFAFPDDDGWVVIGSRGGSGRVPAWARNLAAEPSARVADGPHRVDVVARALEDDEYEAAFERAAETYPGFRLYRREATHRIPILHLKPGGAALGRPS